MSFKKIDCNLTQKFSEYPDFGVLNGVKVFVSGTAIAGPFAGCLMAEMGAKVLQSEAPKISCGTRGTTSWSQNHRNEYSITCNPRTPAGKKIFKKCLEWADIWIESSKAGTYAKMGLTDEVCWGVNSKLCIVHVSGYGQTGPYKSKASYDVSGQAMGGYMYMNGVSPTDVPLKVNPYLSDYVTAYNACMTALSAYIHALKTGKGESCDVAQYDTMFREVQRVYRLQGVEINDKHVEVIVRQCLQKIRVEEPGDSDLLPGSMVDALDFLELNEKLEEEGKELAVGSQVLLGITKARPTPARQAKCWASAHPSRSGRTKCNKPTISGQKNALLPCFFPKKSRNCGSHP